MPLEGANRAAVAMLAHTCYMRDPRVRREAEALAAHGLQVHVISFSEQHDRRGAIASHATRS